MRGTVSQTGLLDLRFAVDGRGRTYLAKRAHRYPMHFTVPLYVDPYRSGMAFVYIQNPSGGIFGDDCLTMDIDVQESAEAHLTTPAATKLYNMEGRKATQAAKIHLHSGSYFEYIPDSIIPQVGSHFEQELSFYLEEGASFISTEMVAPGRLASGEAFEYERLLLKTSVHNSQGELCADTLLLEPDRWPDSRRGGLLGPYTYLATLLAVAPHMDSAALADSLDERVRDDSDALASAGALPSGAGAMVRILANSSPAATSALHEAWVGARKVLLGAPPPRRRK